MRRFFYSVMAGVLAISTATAAFSQTNLTDTVRKPKDTVRSANSGFAEEEFRRGVQSYYRGAFNESILEFEKALSYLPGEPLILDWLGKAYYRSGIEGAALQQWKFAADLGYGGMLLQNRIEIVGDRRIVDGGYGFTQRFTESGSIPPVEGDILIYRQPVSSLANSDGSIWVVAYGSNELLKFDVNGVVTRRLRGPLNGFDRPMDIIRLTDGSLLVSESAGDRLAHLDSEGSFLGYYGTKGRGPGQVIGPQYLAQDSFGNIYVTDFGNARVVVFDAAGTPLLEFGQQNGAFRGFKSPTGIACIEDRIFVADSVYGAIYEFDRAGNYIGILVEEGTFLRPECLKNWNGYLLLTDSNTVSTVDISTGAVYENARTGNAGSLITSAVPDANGNLVVTDFKADEIYVMAKMTELVGGFFVQIERADASAFPEVVLEVRVENRKRQQVVGLKKENFLVTEKKRPVLNMELTGSASNNDVADITILIDRSEGMRASAAKTETAVREIAASMNGKGSVKIISSGSIPVTEFEGSPLELAEFSVLSLKCPYTDKPALDLGIRLAANGLINAECKRGIVYVTEGKSGFGSFDRYALSDLTAFLNNNAVSFSTVLLSEGTADSGISYITDSTPGKSYYVYRSEGLSAVVRDITGIPSGLYQLKYTSSLQTEYGRKYLPVEVEAYLLNRSGRDETGYFAPLQ